MSYQQPVVYGQPGDPQQYNAQQAYQAQPVAYVQPVAYGVQQPAMAGGLLQNSYTTEVPVPIAVPLSLPAATDKPNWDGKAKDAWAGILFWIHVVCILGVAFALGVPAIRDDSSQPQDDPNRATFNLNAALFLKIVTVAITVSAVVSVGAFAVLRRFGGGLIKAALYFTLAVWVVVAGAMFTINFIAGVFMLIPIAIVTFFIYLTRNRIPFAAAHLQAACDATAAHPSLFLAGIAMLIAQALWNLTWAAAALGVERKLNNGATASSTSPANSSDPGNAGVIAMFILLVSYYWGAAVFANVVHFTSSAVVGSWWFVSAPPSPVFNAIKRAFTTSFGSIALGSLVIAILRALEATARAAERQAIKEGRPAAVFAAACLLCLVRCARGIAEVLTHWALIYCALTGESLWDGGRDTLNLFANRGWSLIVNDDLVGLALGISNLMVAGISAGLGAGMCYTLTPSNPNRGTVAAFAAVLTFCMGFMASAVSPSWLMTGHDTSPSVLVIYTIPLIVECNDGYFYAPFPPRDAPTSGYDFHTCLCYPNGVCVLRDEPPCLATDPPEESQ